MNDDRQAWPGPPDPEIESLLELAGEIPAAPSGARDRVLRRVALTVGAPLAAPGPESLGAGSGVTGSGGTLGTAGSGASLTAPAAAGAGAGASVSTAVATGAIGTGWMAVIGVVAAAALSVGIWIEATPEPQADTPAATSAVGDTDRPPARPVESTPGAEPQQPSAPASSGALRETPTAHAEAVAPASAVEQPDTTRPHTPPGRAPIRRPQPDTRRHLATAPAAPPRARAPSPVAPRVIDAVQPTPAVVRPPAGGPGGSGESPTEPPVEPVEVVETPGAPTVPRADAALRLEQRLLADALKAFGRPDLEGASAALHEHRQRFPDGELAGERTLLHIRVLLAQGDDAAARDEADAYREAHPEGLLRPAIDALVPPPSR